MTYNVGTRLIIAAGTRSTINIGTRLAINVRVRLKVDNQPMINEFKKLGIFKIIEHLNL